MCRQDDRDDSMLDREQKAALAEVYWLGILNTLACSQRGSTVQDPALRAMLRGLAVGTVPVAQSPLVLKSCNMLDSVVRFATSVFYHRTLCERGSCILWGGCETFLSVKDRG